VNLQEAIVSVLYYTIKSTAQPFARMLFCFFVKRLVTWTDGHNLAVTEYTTKTENTPFTCLCDSDTKIPTLLHTPEI